MRLSLSASARPAVAGQIKLARLLELPEKGAEDRLKELEADPLFQRLSALGALAFDSDTRARFAALRLGGAGLRTSSEGIGELLDGKGELAALIARVGQELFTECFLDADAALDDQERARRCQITPEQSRRLRELVDRLYIRAEFESPSAAPAAPAAFSPIAGFSIERGRPVIAYFHRDLWKGRWRVDEDKLRALRGSLSPKDARKLKPLLTELEQLERRKSTLRKVLETILELQAPFLVSGKPQDRRPLTQRELARRAGSEPSVINRLIANKSVELPWGLQAPLREFTPSAKEMMRGALHALALEAPGLSDEALRAELARRHGAKLSRRSIAQYRKELGLAATRRSRQRPRSS